MKHSFILKDLYSVGMPSEHDILECVNCKLTIWDRDKKIMENIADSHSHSCSNYLLWYILEAQS